MHIEIGDNYVVVDGRWFVEEEAAKFLVGMLVRLRERATPTVEGLPQPGWYGRVVSLDGNCIAVEFDQPFRLGHRCDNSSLDGHGRWFFPQGQRRLVENPAQLEPMPM